MPLASRRATSACLSRVEPPVYLRCSAGEFSAGSFWPHVGRLGSRDEVDLRVVDVVHGDRLDWRRQLKLD
ncbi:MAG: hypothetical protein ACRETM_07910 [Stenotrophobium sp.]